MGDQMRLSSGAGIPQPRPDGGMYHLKATQHTVEFDPRGFSWCHECPWVEGWGFPPEGTKCPVHNIGDCSPLLNGCSRVIQIMQRTLDTGE